MQQSSPTHMAIHPEPIRLQALQEVGAINIVIGACKVSDEQPCRVTTGMQKLSKAQVVQHILSDVPPLNKSRLEQADHVVKWQVQPVSHCLGQKLDIGIEQRDWPVARQMISHPTWFMHRADQAAEKRPQGSIL
jgi:hypothetical protein